ncbi:hypothetical protein [Butyrivibrio sp. AE3004]|uniref:hypothetical protein n=1 Tax=Butyrivibrio sp. AE3004 TaxID=1506994 RepID=UPI000494C139|nr:hypothetical protein [Butyrivibrio sp. AE3004]
MIFIVLGIIIIVCLMVIAGCNEAEATAKNKDKNGYYAMRSRYMDYKDEFSQSLSELEEFAKSCDKEASAS